MGIYFHNRKQNYTRFHCRRQYRHLPRAIPWEEEPPLWPLVGGVSRLPASSPLSSQPCMSMCCYVRLRLSAQFRSQSAVPAVCWQCAETFFFEETDKKHRRTEYRYSLFGEASGGQQGQSEHDRGRRARIFAAQYRLILHHSASRHSSEVRAEA